MTTPAETTPPAGTPAPAPEQVVVIVVENLGEKVQQALADKHATPEAAQKELEAMLSKEGAKALIVTDSTVP